MMKSSLRFSTGTDGHIVLSHHVSSMQVIDDAFGSNPKCYEVSGKPTVDFRGFLYQITYGEVYTAPSFACHSSSCCYK